MEFSNGKNSRLVTKLGIACGASVLLFAGCVKYRALPIDPRQAEKDYRARTLSDPGLRAYIEANVSTKFSQGPPTSLDLPALTLVGFYYSPEMDIARAEVGATEAGILTAGARPNPAVALGAGHTNSPESPFLFRFSFDLPLETAGKRGHRIEQATRLTETARLKFAETAWQVRSRVRAALLDHLLVVRELALLLGERAARSEAVELLERRLAAGDAARPEVAAVRADLAQADLAIRFAEGQAAETRSALAAALGLTVNALEGVNFIWPNLEMPPNADTVTPAKIQQAGLLNRLDVQRALAEYAASEAALQLEIAKQYPDIHLVPGYSFDEGHNNFTLVPNLVLPVFNRNRGPIAEAAARRKEAAARFLALQARVIGETESSAAKYRAALAEYSEASAALLNLRQSREQVMRKAVDVGEADRLALVSLRLETVRAGQMRLAALRHVQSALGALEDAVQRPLEPAGPLPSVSAESPRDHER